MVLRRYWIEFEPNSDPGGRVRAGCGVTAFDREDAFRLLRERVFAGEELPPIRRVIENVEISALDPGHVRPNMGTPLRRGVWFPLGYDPFP